MLRLLIPVLALAPALPGRAAETGAAVVFSKTSPGAASCVREGDTITLADGALSAGWTIAGNRLAPLFLNEKNGPSHDLKGASLFRIGVEGVEKAGKTSGFVPTNLDSADFTLTGTPHIEKIAADPAATKLAGRSGGLRITADMRAAGGIVVRWSAELRDGSHYLRQTMLVTGTRGRLTGVQVYDVAADGAKQIGTAAAGNPVATGSMFFGFELPMAKNDVSGGRVKAGIACGLPLEAGVVYEFSSVAGTYPKNGLRRAFLAYLERERAAPYRQFLHYNGWFDFDRNVTEKGMFETAAAYDREFVKKRGVPVKAFVVDDGWDDWDKAFWVTDAKKFPTGFGKLGSYLDSIGSGFGIWISPLGGYGGSAAARIKRAGEEKLTRDGAGRLDLSYEPYYKWFLGKTSKLVREDHAKYFKFDKAGDGVNPHFLALLRICHELRPLDRDLVINITVGTWPSPFWLNHIDCTWREGNDMGWEGFGDDREQWITYRDAQTWRGVVSKGPLYPLNAIMTHGIVLSDGHMFAKRALRAGKDMKHEARSFFGSGTAMQELYVKPAITPPGAWDAIAEAAKWSRANADVLVDTHWVGGDPSKGANVYGWAAWSPRKALLTLRNPSDKEKTITVDAGETFEIPEGFPSAFTVAGAYADAPSPVATAKAGTPLTLALKPFEVLVLEFTPVP